MHKWIIQEFSNKQFSTVNVLNSVAVKFMYDSFYYQIEKWDK